MRRVLLIVDDCEEIGRGLRRFLKHHFDAVHVATSPEQAEHYLEQPDTSPTHLLCDYYLGDDLPGGIELVRRWRERHDSIVSAALFSGSELADLPTGNGVDRVFRKPLDIEGLERFFAAPATSA